MPSLQASMVCATKADVRDWIYSTGWTKIEDILYGSMSIATYVAPATHQAWCTITL